MRPYVRLLWPRYFCCQFNCNWNQLVITATFYIAKALEQASTRLQTSDSGWSALDHSVEVCPWSPVAAQLSDPTPSQVLDLLLFKPPCVHISGYRPISVNSRFLKGTKCPSTCMQWTTSNILTLTISALLAPQATKMTHLAFRRTGNVNVILWDGGFGESLTAATHRWFSCAQYTIHFSYTNRTFCEMFAMTCNTYLV